MEGPYNSLTITGRQKVAERWRVELIKVGNAALRGKPNDIRAILDSEFVALVDGEEQGKMFRLAIEMAKIDGHLASGQVASLAVNKSTIRLVKEIPDDLLSLAKADPEIGPYLLKPELYRAIKVGDEFVGTIRKDASAEGAKIGSIFISPKYRGKGYASLAIEEALGEKAGFAFISPTNTASQNTFAKLGFTKGASKTFSDGEVLDIWQRGPTATISEAGKYSAANIASKMPRYKTALALEQDASSSGAQIIALTTRNKKLAELSNVIPTRQKKRLNQGLYKSR